MSVKIECILECNNHLGEGPVWDVEEGRLYWLDCTGPRLITDFAPGPRAPPLSPQRPPPKLPVPEPRGPRPDPAPGDPASGSEEDLVADPRQPAAGVYLGDELERRSGG